MASPSEAPNRRQSRTTIDAAATAFEPLAERSNPDGAITQLMIYRTYHNPPATMRLNRLVSDRGVPKR
jgi:hypothetical protein